MTSDYSGLGIADITLTQVGNHILNANGDTAFNVDLDSNPVALLFNPHGELAYSGHKLK